MVVGLASALLATDFAWACGCIAPMPKEWLDKATLAFRGRVTAVREVTWSDSTDGTQFRSKEVTFSVIERFKGPKAITYRLFTGDCTIPESMRGYKCSNSCEARAELDHEYVVYAFPDANGRPEISTCGTFDVKKRSTWASDLLRELRGSGAVEQ